VARSAARRDLPGEASPDQPDALGMKCIRRRSTVTKQASPSWQERPGAGLLDAWASSPGYTARFTKAATLTASVPIWSRTLGPALLIGREHGGTLFASDDRPSGAPAQKSKQHQDQASDSHNVLLLCDVGSMQSPPQAAGRQGKRDSYGLDIHLSIQMLVGEAATGPRRRPDANPCRRRLPSFLGAYETAPSPGRWCAS
jgi:hypothetical protein